MRTKPTVPLSRIKRRAFAFARKLAGESVCRFRPVPDERVHGCMAREYWAPFRRSDGYISVWFPFDTEHDEAARTARVLAEIERHLVAYSGRGWSIL